MVTVLVLTWSSHGTWDFNELLQHPEGKHSGWLAALLVAAAMLKSAQFPFHSWLPDTLETPTPVSALMHAGVVNAGGFLIVRLSPLVAESQAALNTLALIGAFTAVFASVIMMTQSSIKKSLAWSTVAQMGFMMLQCGLGAFALAVMHLVAHSLYKAYAFLSSGSIVDISRSSWQPVGRPAAHPLVVLGSLVTAAAIGFGMAKVYGLHLNDNHGQALLLAVFVIAIAYLLWTLWGSSMRRRLIVSGLFIATVATASCLTLHTAFERFLGSSVAAYEPVRSPIEYVTMGIVALIFLAVLILQSQLPAWAAHPSFARLYVHAANGFYFGSFFRKSPSHLHP
jgi:NAD(P)H-quinone oxidoreductase subunit 5